MSKLDETKERITQLRYWMGAFLAATIGLGSWLFNNIEAPYWKLSLVSILFVVGILLIFVVNQKISKQISFLGDL